MTVIKDVSGNADPGTATKWGGNNIMVVDNYLDDIDISGSIVNGTGAIRINTPTRFRSTKLILRDSGNDHNYIFVTSNLAANRNITYPVLTGDDVPVFENQSQTLINKTLTTPTLSTPILNTPTLNGAKLAQSAKTANYTMTATDFVIRADASAGAFTITLPAAATAGAGTVYVIIRTDLGSSTNLLTVDGNSTETIDGIATWKLHPGQKLSLMSDGTNWVTVWHDNPSRLGYYYLGNSTNNRRYVAGLTGSINDLTTTTSSPAANTLWAIPFYVGKVTKFDTITFIITTAQAAQNARAGIYFDNGNMYPGALIFDTGAISTGTTGAKDTTITSSLQNFQPGLYWLAWETSATTIQIRGLTTGTAVHNFAGDNNVIDENGQSFGYSVAHTFGALPDPYTAAATLLVTSPSATNAVPAIGLRPV